MLLAWLLAQQCPLRAQATRLEQHKDASGHFPQCLAAPPAAPGEWHQRPRGGARAAPPRPAPAAPPRAHRGRRWGLRPECSSSHYSCRYSYRAAVYRDRRREPDPGAGRSGGPLRGNGPLTGYAYLFLTRPHFLDEHLYLRALIAPVYATGEVIRNHLPTPTAPSASGSAAASLPPATPSFRTAVSIKRTRSLATRPKRRWPTTCVARRSPASSRSRPRSVCARRTSCTTATTTRRTASSCPRTP